MADPGARRPQPTTTQMIQMLTTEQFTLQTARAAAIAEANGRASIFLASVASALVALGFIGQISRVGDAFIPFGLVLCATLLFLGLATFERVLQSAIEDLIYRHGMNRIRHFYVEIAPRVADYLVLPTYDDATATAQSLALTRRWGRQRLLTLASTVAVINSVLLGAFVGLLTSTLLSLPLLAYVGIGVGAGLISLVLHQRYQEMRWQEMRRMPVRFPTP
jgi:hypothetical protein